MAMRSHSGSPQIAFKVIPRAALATMRGRLSVNSSIESRLRGDSSPSTLIQVGSLIFRPSLVHLACLHNGPPGSFPSRRICSLSSQGAGVGCISSQSIGYKNYSFGRLLSSSLLLVRSFGDTQLSSLNELEEDCKEGKVFGNVDSASDHMGASSTIDSVETRFVKQVSYTRGDELESLRIELRAHEVENERLRLLYEQVRDELKVLKLERLKSGVSQSATSTLSSDEEASQVYQSETTYGRVNLAKVKEESSVMASKNLKIGATTLSENAMEQSSTDFDEAEESSSFTVVEKANVGVITFSESKINPVEDNYGPIDFATTDQMNSTGSEVGKLGRARDQEARKTPDVKDDGSMFQSEKKTAASSFSENGEAHPWPEWNNFLTHLKEKSYFPDSADSMDDEESEDTGRIKKAALHFGRERDDIFESFSKNDLKVVACFGCPSTDKKVINAGKRLRAYLGISESSVCQPCTLKSTCGKAFAESEVRTAGTTDVIRLLLQIALDVEESVDAKLSLPTQVERAVLSLLKQAVEVSEAPRDLTRPRPDPRKLLTASTGVISGPVGPRGNSHSMSEQFEMKPGDWRCQECHYVNFSRNRNCRECSAARPQQEMRPGDWECPKCQYLNYSSNMECRDCHAERPRRSAIQSMRGSHTFDGRQGSRERSFGNRERENRRNFGDIHTAGTRYPHQERKVYSNKTKRKSDDDLDEDLVSGGESEDLEDEASELDEDSDEEFSDLDLSEEEVEHPKSEKKRNYQSSHKDFDDLDDSNEQIDYVSDRKKSSHMSFGSKFKTEDGGDSDDIWDELDRPKGRGKSRGGRITQSEYSDTNGRSFVKDFSRGGDFSRPRRGGFDREGRGGYGGHDREGRGGYDGRSRGRGSRDTNGGNSSRDFPSSSDFSRPSRGGYDRGGRGGYRGGSSRGGGSRGGFQNGRGRGGRGRR